jgi:hypothetical protein
MVMKTTAFKTVLGLAIATLFVGSQASAQMKAVVAPKRVTKLKTSIKAAAPKEEAKSPFGLEIVNSAQMFDKKAGNFLVTELTASYEVMENVSLNLYGGFDTYFYNTEDNAAYDLEPSIGLSGMKLFNAIDFSGSFGGLLPTSRDAHNTGRIGGYSISTDLGGSLAGIGLGMNNTFYQFAYKSSPGPTPALEDFDEDPTYKNNYTTYANVVSFKVPIIGGLKWSNDVRNRIKTYFDGHDLHQLRLRTRLSYSFGAVTAQAGTWSQKDITKAGSLFQPKSRAFFVNLIVGI